MPINVRLLDHTSDPTRSLYLAYRVAYSALTPQQIADRIESEKITRAEMEDFIEKRLETGHASPLEQVWFDTSASHLLYDDAVYRRVIDLVGVEKILWGSDFPLTTQAKALDRTRAAEMSDGERAAILGGNAAALLGLGAAI